MYRSTLLIISCLLIPNSLVALQEEQAGQLTEFFERNIRPILSDHCFECHSERADTLHASLSLDSRDGIDRGGDSGKLIDRKSPENSFLLKVLQYEGDIQMPPDGRLPEKKIRLISEWIQKGAFLPEHTRPARPKESPINFAQGRLHWSFQPATIRPLPVTKKQDWPRNRIDYFILEKLEEQNLQPAPPASSRVLVRRLFFDLTGLPPHPEQVRIFENEPSEKAWIDLVDRLLESPRYGEKWGRKWLDLARYTDKTASWLYKSEQAHLYRDWVIQALNDDMRYDEFVHRQLATDMLNTTGLDDLPALGFMSLSPTYWKELKLPAEIIKTIVADEWEERVDAVSRTFLGLTVSCARCHDHKFDPISSRDYYALAGVFASSRQVERPMIQEELYAPVRDAKKKIQSFQQKLAELNRKKEKNKQEIDSINAEISQLKATPHFNTPLASALSEEALFVVRKGKKADEGTLLNYRSHPRDLPLYIRGNPNRPGPIVPRRFLTVLSPSDSPTPFKNGSGRLELARAITNESASLAARVIVNRIWLGHFGKGLVSTPSNFGIQGSPPTHPELLEDLAARFIKNDWSLKKLHREILLSATWRQSAVPSQRKLALDPENNLLSRMNRRKLDFEEWRDAMLLATEKLNFTMGGRSVDLSNPENFRRTLYSTIHRRDISITLRMHDFPDPTQHSPKRTSTVTPLQGLFALNSRLLNQQAAFLVDRLNRKAADDVKKIETAYLLLFSRLPIQEEIDLGLSFLTARDANQRELWIQYAHVLLAGNELMWVD